MTNPPHITIVGLGPGDPQLLTLQAWKVLQSAPEIWLRTSSHPIITHLPPAVRVHTLVEDALLTQRGPAALAERLIELARRPQGVVVALPGAPGFSRALAGAAVPNAYILGAATPGTDTPGAGTPGTATPGNDIPVAGASGLASPGANTVVPVAAGLTTSDDAVVSELLRQAGPLGLSVQIVPGVSALEPTCALLELAPSPHLSLVDAIAFSHALVPPFPPNAPALITNLTPPAAPAVQRALLANYPPGFPLRLALDAGSPQARVEELTLQDLLESVPQSYPAVLYLPALGPSGALESFQEVVARLRAPDGCPWDREQTHRSLRDDLLEEAYEVLDALDREDLPHLQEELGDLLLHILLQAQIAVEAGEFSLPQVISGIHTKIVRRHPHVFGDLDLQETSKVLQNWEKLKAAERAANGKAQAGLLDGVLLSLPALAQADEYQKRAARVGFDWPSIDGVLAKLHEELGEIQSAPDAASRAAEVGDLLFAAVNYARWLDVTPESALREANQRFRQRFSHIETSARQQGRSISDLTLDEMETLWQEAKHR